MSVKTLRKQLLAAIAMVLVAAIALGSSTYAWFVTNNKVDATTTNISAQSNAAFMTIHTGATGASGVDTTTVSTALGANTKLYPATFGEETLYYRLLHYLKVLSMAVISHLSQQHQVIR